MEQKFRKGGRKSKKVKRKEVRKQEEQTNRFRSQIGAFELEHILFQDKVLAPEGQDVCLETATGRAIVVETRDAAIDVERGHVKEASLKERVKGSLAVFEEKEREREGKKEREKEKREREKEKKV